MAKKGGLYQAILTGPCAFNSVLWLLDIDGIFAPSRTSHEIPLKVGFTIETKTKMQKLLGFLEILEKMAFIPKSLG